jgi:hypothetical protein
MERKYQVFLSSTYKDLVAERKIALEEILKAKCIPVGMELFPATHSDPLKYIREVIDDSDFYLLIIAGKYGSELHGKSFTEHEYDYAREKSKIVIAFIHENIGQLPQEKTEQNSESIKKLRKFKNKLSTDVIVKQWGSGDQLAERILHALHELKEKNATEKTPVPGWIKASNLNLKNIASARNKNLELKLTRLTKQLEEARRIKIQPNSIEHEHQNLSRLVQKRFVEIDQEANKIFGDLVISSRTGKEIQFSSAKIADSLSLLGIPIHICCEVIDKCLDELRIMKRKAYQLSTSDIRRAVAEVLYRVELSGISQKRVQLWADSYIRKYGNPTKQLMVLDDQGRLDAGVVNLSFALIREKVLMDVARSIYPDDYMHRLSGIRREDRETFSEEVIRHVKNMDIYRIHYSSLVIIAKELALSPPHPWFVETPKIEDAVRYDLERSSHHSNKLKQMLRSRILTEGLYSIKECIHHSCSGILALYGVFLGCGYMSPFYNLQHHVVEFKNERESDAFLYSDISKLFEDLSLIHKPINEIISVMDELKHKIRLDDFSKWDVASDLASRAIYLSDIFEQLVSNRMPQLSM